MNDNTATRLESALRLPLILLALSAIACATTGGLVSIQNSRISPLPAMVAKKCDVPLYIVATPTDVPEQIHVPKLSFAMWTVSAVDLSEVRLFATRDLKAAFENYFSTVQVIDDSSKLPQSRHVRAQVKVVKVEYDRRVSAGEKGQRNDIFAAMEWGFALGSSEDSDFMFSFSDRSASPQPMKSTSDTGIFASAMEEGLRRMFAEYNRAGVHQKLIGATAVAAPAAN